MDSPSFVLFDWDLQPLLFVFFVWLLFFKIIYHADVCPSVFKLGFN